MSTRSRRAPPPSSASSSSAARRPQIARPANKKPMTTETQVAKKRTALADVTNQKNGVRSGPPNFISSSKPLVPCATKVARTTKETSGNAFPGSLSTKSSILAPFRESKTDPTVEFVATGPSPSSSGKKFVDGLRSTNGSPSRSVSGSVSLDESMSTCDSLKSPEFEYIDNEDISEVKSIEKKTTDSLCISGYRGKEGNIWKKDIFAKIETADKVVDVDNNLLDPQFCATFASDIYKHLRESEANRRPSMDFMEKIQNDINAGMRAILIDWLVEVAEEFRFVPDTLFLTVNYVDRYLSGIVMNRKRLQLLGVTCMMIAAKYEEIIVPQVEQFCYITDNTYVKEEVLQMESSVLEHLKYEMTAPTAICFLRRFSFVAQQTSEVPSVHFQCLASYIAELSLLEYSMLCYAPSLIAASAAFLAKYILSPTKKPWNSTLRHYTHYQASDLCDCVKALLRLCCNGCSSDLPAVREKYCQHKYKFVAKKYCPASIPPEFFQDLSN